MLTHRSVTRAERWRDSDSGSKATGETICKDVDTTFLLFTLSI